MLCEHAREYLLDYMDNELPAVFEQELAEHVRACLECREELEALRKTGLLLQLRAVPEPPAAYWEKAWTGIRARTAARVVPMSPHKVLQMPSWLRAPVMGWRSRLAVAALVIAGIAGALFSLRSEMQPLADNKSLPFEIQLQPVAQEDLTAEMERQMEILTYISTAAVTLDPISKSARFAKLEDIRK